MNRFTCRLLLPACLALAGAAHAQALDTRLVADGLTAPLFATAPLADGRVFVVEQGGTIVAVQGGSASTFFTLPVATGGERGLLGLAFDPNYGVAGSAGYGRFFINYIDPATLDTVVASYRALPGAASVDLSTRTEVLRIDQPDFANHKGGWIDFKPGNANNLYIATGDGGDANDPLNNAQNTGSLLGKMLRVDVNRDDFADPNVNYGVPTDNPLLGRPGARGEIFAYGLRNPWRNSFDRLSGDLWIADVGQGAREEVNVLAAGSPGGQNYGWRVREGDIATPGVGGPLEPGMVDPDLVYDHSVGQSITGGYVVRDPTSPLNGKYVFGDFSTGRIWAVDADGSVSFADAAELTALLDAGSAGPIGLVASFGEGASGELYIVDYNGRVLQVIGVVPEPAALALWAAGLGLLVLRRRWPGAPRAPSVA